MSAEAKDLENGDAHLDNKMDGSTNTLRQMMTNNTISDEQFERLFLQPRINNNNDFRKTFANPTPLAIMGFSVGLTPISCEFMGWRGAGGAAQATVGASIWFGGLLLILAGLGEFILGNTFPFIVFMGYGCHFLTLATTFIPFFNAVSAYTTGNPYIGEENQMQSAQFAESYGFYPLSLAILSFVFLICSLRTNLFFFLIFVVATMGFGFASASFWFAAQGLMNTANEFLVATGACFFAASMFGWYLLLAIMIPTMELPIPAPPVFDLSTVVRAKKQK